MLCCSTVDEEKVMPGQGTEDRGHYSFIGCSETSHMIISSDDIRKLSEISVYYPVDLSITMFNENGITTRIITRITYWLHRNMQHNLSSHLDRFLHHGSRISQIGQN